MKTMKTIRDEMIEKAGGAENFIDRLAGLYPNGHRWGCWQYDKPENVLAYIRDGSSLYEVDIADMTNARACLDWIFQVTAKTWCTALDCRDLIEAIRDLVNPQARLCSCGIGSGVKRGRKL
jgi:hypothetical protein